MCLDSAFSFQCGDIVIIFMVQASNIAVRCKGTTKGNSISYWLSLAQLKANVFFRSAFRMHVLLHKSLIKVLIDCDG